VRLGVLGPLLVADEAGRQVRLAGRGRVLLAALALRANHVVSAEELTELVFDGAPSAGSTLRSYIWRLRAVLGPVWAQRIVTSPSGYLCRADEQEVDALWFESLCRQTDTAIRERRWAQASRSAELAVSLWRGDPLFDVPSRILRDEFTPRLEQLHAQVLGNQAEAALALGRHEQWVQPLRDLVAEHPLRERFHAQLMQALSRSGRQAEALAAYHDARKILVDELGIEPGLELRQLHERILTGEGDPNAPCSSADPASEGAPAAAAPRQLPAAAGHFTGRRQELDRIIDLLGPSQPTDVPGGTVVISAIDGMAGIGKTTLAVHAAHRLAEKFSDGQLFIDLHGYTEGQRPRTPGEALNWLLRALGAPPGQIPTDEEQAAALYRQHLADTRTLIVLDNAATEAQVRPLLPGCGSCLVLVTSRRRLRGLDAAHALSLDLLAAPEAVALLRAVAGPERVPADDPLSGEIAELCGYLPLAVRIAAALLRHRPAWTLEHLAGLLRDRHRRVQALSDGERDLPAVFDLSYQGLAEPHRALFRRLGLVPGPDLDPYAAAALLDVAPAIVGGLLEDLVDHNLLLCHASGRYRLHDLVRAHARNLAAEDPRSERDAAVDRLLRYYAHTAHRASIPIARCARPAPDGPAPAHAPALPGPDTARAWLRAERDNLEHAVTYADAHNLYEHTLALSAGLAEILRTDGPYPRALALHQAAADTAEHHGQPTAHANALTDLGIMQRLSGDLTGAGETLSQALKIYRVTGDRHGEADTLAELGRARGYAGDLAGAFEAFAQALEIYRATGDRHGEADMLAELGIMRRVSGDLAEAVTSFSQALEIYRVTGDRHGEADALTELGRVRALIGDLSGADDAFGQALEFFRATGHHHGEAYALTNLGAVRRLSGDLAGAYDALSKALEIYRAVGYGQGEAEALTNLGAVRRLSGDLAGAGDAQARALEIYREIDSRHDEAWALNHYADTVAAGGDLPRALTLYQQALTMNRELNKPDGQALALEGLGVCHLTAGETETGAAHLRQALEILQRLGMAADAERVRTRLVDLATV
jgi:DNA-binding SARP family transcriptional activator/Tfp pilus assembly protein PilF